LQQFTASSQPTNTTKTNILKSVTRLFPPKKKEKKKNSPGNSRICTRRFGWDLRGGLRHGSLLFLNSFFHFFGYFCNAVPFNNRPFYRGIAESVQEYSNKMGPSGGQGCNTPNKGTLFEEQSQTGYIIIVTYKNRLLCSLSLHGKPKRSHAFAIKHKTSLKPNPPCACALAPSTPSIHSTAAFLPPFTTKQGLLKKRKAPPR
jgi:hypothetical protein